MFKFQDGSERHVLALLNDTFRTDVAIYFPLPLYQSLVGAWANTRSQIYSEQIFFLFPSFAFDCFSKREIIGNRASELFFSIHL